jgi:hypothetical protein
VRHRLVIAHSVLIFVAQVNNWPAMCRNRIEMPPIIPVVNQWLTERKSSRGREMVMNDKKRLPNEDNLFTRERADYEKLFTEINQKLNQ